MDEHGARRAVRDPARADCTGTPAAPGGKAARSRDETEDEASKDEAREARCESAAHVQDAGCRRRGRDEVDHPAACLACGRKGGFEVCRTPHSGARLESLVASAGAAPAGSAPAASSGTAVAIAAAGGFATTSGFGTSAATSTAAARYDDVDFNHHHLDYLQQHQHDDDVDHYDHHVAAADDYQHDDHRLDHDQTQGRLKEVRGPPRKVSRGSSS
jgi:hypothetical protein